MQSIIVSNDIKLIKYYPYYSKSLIWYQDYTLCKQVDNIDFLYDLNRLKAMYDYLNKNGELYYIKYKGKLVGDVSLQNNYEVAIVIEKNHQNLHIGRNVINAIIERAKAKKFPKLIATIYSFNIQSKKMFLSCGFKQINEERFELKIMNDVYNNIGE